jgi:hypothetical protein
VSDPDADRIAQRIRAMRVAPAAHFARRARAVIARTLSGRGA